MIEKACLMFNRRFPFILISSKFFNSVNHVGRNVIWLFLIQSFLIFLQERTAKGISTSRSFDKFKNSILLAFFSISCRWYSFCVKPKKYEQDNKKIIHKRITLQNNKGIKAYFDYVQELFHNRMLTS